jgi:hypothetical protein
MGLFSKSKKASASVPMINVNLNTPQDHVFKPNDAVSGHITLSTPIPLNPQAIEATLWGRSAVWTADRYRKTNDQAGDDYHHYRDHVILFNVTFNVLTEKHLQPGQTYTFPFQFRFPEGTSTNRVGGYKDDRDSRWTVQPHSLPPTFMWGNFDDSPDHAKITYGVTGRLVCPGVGAVSKGDKPIEDTTPILFQPFNPHLNRPFTVVRHTKALTLASSALAGQKKKFSDRFSSSTPKMDFEVGIEAPDYLTSGSEFRFRSTFSVLNKSDNVVGIPPITFKVLKLELHDFTFLRAARDLESDFTSSGYHYDRSPEDRPTGAYSGIEDYAHPEQKTALNSQPESSVVQLEEVMAPGEKKGMEQARSCEVWFSARVPGFTPPSFYSFAIKRSYSIKIKMGVEVGGKKFDYEIESQVMALGSSP